MSKIKIARKIKNMVEQVACRNCDSSMLSFDSINFEYNNESVVVKANCQSCDSNPYIVIENVPRQ